MATTTKAVTYRGHTITKDTDSILRAFSLGDGDGDGTYWRIEGPHLKGHSGGSLVRVKRWVDDNIRHHECYLKTKHARRTPRKGCWFCDDCGSITGAPPQPGDGATWTFWRTTSNGYRIGYSKTRDIFGKWYAIEVPPRGVKRRLVKCATRAKAKAKSVQWWQAQT